MSSFSHNMQNLTAASHLLLTDKPLAVDSLPLNDQKTAAPKTKRRQKSRRVPMPLEVPNLHTPGRKLYYAFDVNRAWIVQYAETYWDDYMGTDVDEVEDDAKISSAIYMLITQTGVSNMTFGLGLPNDTSAANGTTGTDEDVPLITVCSSRRGSYFRRPTQAQFDRLEGIVGRRARWWIDAEPDY